MLCKLIRFSVLNFVHLTAFRIIDKLLIDWNIKAAHAAFAPRGMGIEIEQMSFGIFVWLFFLFRLSKFLLSFKIDSKRPQPPECLRALKIFARSVYTRKRKDQIEQTQRKIRRRDGSRKWREKELMKIFG